ncbi:Cupredoxin [Penicillium odoratum]|uniref:Cupredoxin n=1 Tax=Penicillium odoratum TaxID=1167516 RepID=UPI00254966A9|nr:Cupredoxin [Penicillium odoratum]KAJ5771553.1 Cupredoxin [Penicillium odoratum]
MASISKLILVLFWLSGINAQYGGGQSNTTTTSVSSSVTKSSSSTSLSATKSVQSVDVGEDGFTFSPDTLTASAGDKIEFHFYPGNHSVTQAAFAKPCQPLNNTSIFSGFVPATSGESKTVFTVVVNDTNPIWLYCAQIGHCQAGMVAVINPPNQDALSMFKAAAAKVSESSEPSAVQGGTLGVPRNSSTSTSSSSTNRSTSGSTSSSSSSSSSSSGSTSSSTPTSSLNSSSTSSRSSSPSSTSTGSPSLSQGNTLYTWNDASIALTLSAIVGMLMH